MTAREEGIELVICLGGGSAMDTAKAIAVCVTNDRPLRELFPTHDFPEKPLPIICIPTTAGTGSEMNGYSIITDEKVNDKLREEKEIDYRYKNWHIRSIEWSNFLSYGDDNKLNFDELGGIINVNSEPANMGGKSTMTKDLLLYLFFNTTTKGSKAIDMFNKFRPDCNEVKVKGKVTIDGVDYIIDRRVKRVKKRNGLEYTTRTDLTFQKIMPDGSTLDLEGEQRRETDDLIKKSIGSVDDFLLTIIADSDNIENLIRT